MRERYIGWILMVGLLLVPLGGAMVLFRLRFVAGDIYPPYSSLRADPLGARALCESLERLPGVTVRRHLRPLPRLPEGAGATLFLLGCQADDLDRMPVGDLAGLERFVRGGGRLVLSVAPASALEEALGLGSGSGGTNAPGRPARPARGGRGGPTPGGEEFVSLFEAWGVRWTAGAGAAGTNVTTAVRAATAAVGLPEVLPWLGKGTLAVVGSGGGGGAGQGTPGPGAWRAVYQVGEGDQALVMESALGRGERVLCSESFLFSNEALRHRREAAFLRWTLGAAGRVLFDETHLGVSEEPGVGTLGRRYRLQGLLLGLLGFAALWVWRRTLPLVPVRTAADPAQGLALVQGRDSVSGLVSLLRLHVPPGEILMTCFREWRRHCAPAGGVLAGRAERMEVVMVREANLPPRERNPVGAYRELMEILSPGPGRRRSGGTSGRGGGGEKQR